ncbi:hypothetical protein PMAYCL1PPCAC_24054, partial [Pristionchus mayeri]
MLVSVSSGLDLLLLGHDFPSFLRDVVRGNEVSNDVPTPDHFTHEKPERDLKCDCSVDKSLTDGELTISSALDHREHLLRVRLQSGPLRLSGRGEFVLEDPLEKGRSERPLSSLMAVDGSSEIGDLLEEAKTAGRHL